ncbi:MAG: DUF86 domain-containing protein [Thermodesulfobacteriota bacterium]
MKRVLTDYAADLFEAVSDITEFVSGLTYEQFAADKKTVNAVIRSLEVLGEAAKKMPEEVKARHPDIPWKQMAGMRDKLIHEYHGVDNEIVWTVATRELPALRQAIERLRDELNP